MRPGNVFNGCREGRVGLRGDQAADQSAAKRGVRTSHHRRRGFASGDHANALSGREKVVSEENRRNERSGIDGIDCRAKDRVDVNAKAVERLNQ
jgi:hypothetical protein